MSKTQATVTADGNITLEPYINEQLINLVNTEMYWRYQVGIHEFTKLVEASVAVKDTLSDAEFTNLISRTKQQLADDITDAKQLTTNARAAADADNGILNFALYFNKLSVILDKAHEKIGDIDYTNSLFNGEFLTQIDSQVTPHHSAAIGDIKGSGDINYAQTLLLELLATHYNCTINEVPALANNSIYNPVTSPNIQSVSLTAQSVNTVFNNNTWYYKDEQSPEFGEVAIPHSGYFFGGSRNDVRHQDKLFKAEDCSSSVAKWLGTNMAFSTHHMEYFHKNGLTPSQDLPNNLSDNEYEKFDNYVASVAQVMQVRVGIDTVEPGDVFLKVCHRELENGTFKRYGGHTGIVNELLSATEDNNLIGVDFISYNRDLEGQNMEGL
ncbi:MAG: hypothetical protein AAF153_01250, partial [Pseudomonadota bacterium]